jgi:branched-chain amino acid transport system permease protein
MNYLLQQIINSLGFGSIVALLAAGYTMTFGLIGLVNFAHGEVFMAGAFTAYFILTILKLPFWLAVLMALVGSIVIGLLVERLAFKPVRGSGMITLFIIGLGVSQILRNSTVMLFDARLKGFTVSGFLKGVYMLGEVMIFKKTLFIFLAVLVICTILVYLIKNTKIGIAMRSISYDTQMAQSLGMNTERIIIITFAISSALAGFAAVSWGYIYGSVHAGMGVYAVVNAFVASVIGGVGNVLGAVIAGYIIAIGGNLFIAFLPPDLVGLRPLFVWIVFFIILIFKPSGLFRANIK